MTVPAAENLRREYVAAPMNVTDDLLTAMLNAADMLVAIDALCDDWEGNTLAAEIKALLHPAPEEDK